MAAFQPSTSCSDAQKSAAPAVLPVFENLLRAANVSDSATWALRISELADRQSLCALWHAKLEGVRNRPGHGHDKLRLGSQTRHGTALIGVVSSQGPS